MNWFQEWALTLAIFLPAVGLAIILLLPKAEETAAKVVALAHDARHARRRHRRSSPSSTTTTSGRLQFVANEPWIDVIKAALPPRDRRHLAAAAHPVDVRHGPVRHLLLEPLPGAAQPEGASSR